MELECLAYGVGQADEGVCLLLQIGSYRVLLDCGLTNISPLLPGKKGAPADLVLCTHAHADHARGLLGLHQAFPKLPIYASEVTTQLLPLNWPDLATKKLSLFCQALPWRTPIEVLDGLTVELYPAGHLPGAAAIVLTYIPSSTETTSRASYRVIYTGDFFLSNSRLVEGLPLEEMRSLHPNVLIVEGSYGTARHPHRRQQENQLAERINQAIADHHSILLPTPPLGLGQELLMLLRSHHYFTGRDIDIWVDGLVVKGCDAYLELLPHLPTTVQNFARHQALFWDERVRPRVRRLTAADRPTLGQRPCIVITDETADLRQYYRDQPQDWLVLLPQEPHRLAEGGGPSAPSPRTETYLLAQHCDGPGTTQLIHNLRPQHVILVHGPLAYLSDLTGLEELHNRYHLHTPAAGTRVELPIGETFLQPAPPETSYEGELSEIDTVVTITLSTEITSDPRWRALADTGLIEAHWQGEELVLRGVSQQELLRQGSDRLLDWMDGNSPLRNCCGNCRHYRGQRCWNSASPLFEFKVTPEGFCPAFASVQWVDRGERPEKMDKS
jgi:Cft2 family RNA processing exonuclease